MMQEIAELERRITAALERIGRGVESLGGQSEVALPAENEVAQLTEALDEERMANAQLTERLRVVRDKDAAEKAGLAAARDDLQTRLDAHGEEVNRLRRSLDQVNGELADLRDLAALSVVEPEHINKAMLAELEALRSARASEALEIAEIVAALNPLISEGRTHA